MKKRIDWQAITEPLDVFDIAVPKNILRRWLSYTPTETGAVFHCETAGGRPAECRVDIVLPDVIRLRMNPDGVRERESEMLTSPPGDEIPPFTLHEHENHLALSTERVRVEVQRFPWQVRVFDRDADTPFFRQRIDDRAYGPAYEVAPVGWSEEPPAVHESIAAAPGERFYGFGEKYTTLNKWGHEIVSWAIDSGNVTSHRAYKNIPFFMSSAGYGLFVHASHPIVYRMGTDSSISYAFHVMGSQLDYFLIRGPAFSRILARYCQLTGFAPVPPKWSFGYWQSRAGYRSRAEVEQVAQEMRARGFPCDVISIDPWWMGDCAWCTLAWEEEAFPNPAEMIANLRAEGIRTCLWITPYIAEGNALYEEGMEKGYFLHRPDGTLSPVKEAFAGGAPGGIDFTNPEAEAWYLAQLEKLLDMGAAVFKTDFGEQAPVDCAYHDGRSGLEMHNLYPLLYNRAVFGLTARKFGRGLVWARSAYAGSQRYPVGWGGDSYASFDQMAGQLRGLLSYGMSGVPFCSHDVGGFDYAPAAFDQDDCPDVGEHVTSVGASRLSAYPKDPEVYVRWMQFGAFSSHVRAHGKNPREPWTYGEEAERICRDYLRLRYRLLPYIYTQAVRAAQTGLPVVRPMVLHYQDDPNVYTLDTQYLFGESFLVAPVLNREGRARVYLPAGTWVDYWTKRPTRGPRWLDIAAPLDRLPLWVRGGAIVPMGPAMDYVDQMPLDPLTLEIYAPDASGELRIHDEDKPPIAVRYRLEGSTLAVEVDGAPGEVAIDVYPALDVNIERTSS